MVGLSRVDVEDKGANSVAEASSQVNNGSTSPSVKKGKQAQFLLSWLKHFHIEFDSIRIIIDGNSHEDSDANIVLAMDLESLVFTRKITANNCNSKISLSHLLLRFNPCHSKTHVIMEVAAVNIASDVTIVRDEIESQITQNDVDVDKFVYSMNLEPQVHVDWMWFLQSTMPVPSKKAGNTRARPPFNPCVYTTKTKVMIKSSVISSGITATSDIILDMLTVVNEEEVSKLQVLDVNDVTTTKRQKLSLSLGGIGNELQMSSSSDTPLIVGTFAKEMEQLNGIDMDIFVTCTSVLQPTTITLPLTTITSILFYWSDVSSLLPVAAKNPRNNQVKPSGYCIDIKCAHAAVTIVGAEFSNALAVSNVSVATTRSNHRVIQAGVENVTLSAGRAGSMNTLAALDGIRAVIELEECEVPLPVIEVGSSLNEWRQWCDQIPDSTFTKTCLNMDKIDIQATTDSVISIGLLQELICTLPTSKLPKGRNNLSSDMIRVHSMNPRGNNILEVNIRSIGACLEYSDVDRSNEQQCKRVSCLLHRGIMYHSKSIGEIPIARLTKVQVHEDMTVIYHCLDTNTPLINIHVPENISNERVVLEGVQAPLYVVGDSYDVPKVLILQSEKTLLANSSIKILLANQDFRLIYAAVDAQTQAREAVAIPWVNNLSQYHREIYRLRNSNSRLVEYNFYKDITSTTKVCLESLVVDCFYNTSHVYSIHSGKTNVYSIQHGSTLTQVCGSTTSLSVVDLSLDVLHKTFIQNIANLAPNEVFFHASNKFGTQPLIEVKLDRLCLIYKQRSLMTMICYFRDHLLPSMLNYRLPSELYTPVNDGLLSSILPAQWHRNTVTTPYGMCRLNLLFNIVELHVPVSSNGNDALVVVATSLVLTKSAPEYSESYIHGPMLSKRQSVNYLDVMNKLVSLDIVRDALVNELMTTDMTTATSSQPPTGCSINMYKIVFNDSTICSWCNNNAIGENMTITVSFSIQPVSPEFDGVYSRVFSALQFNLHRWKKRNISNVTVEIGHIQWKLAQGQYMSIVRMIQQNFPELTVQIPDPFVAPIPKIVQLKETIYGTNAIEQRLPIVSDVKIIIHTGSIMALKNNSEYYELINRLLHISEPKDELVEIMEEEKGITEHNTIPAWSYHQVYTRKINQKIKRESSSQFADDKPDSSTKPLNAIITIFFEDLSLRFYRMHFGGGNGMDVSTRTMIITKCLGLNEHEVEVAFNDSGSLSTIDLRQIASETIIFGPKWCFDPDKRSSTSDTATDVVASEEPHIRYTQHGVGNLRRCIVDIIDSYAVAHVEDIIAAVRYFVDPITLTALRNFERLDRKGLSTLDFKAALDLEVHTKNIVITLPNTVSHEGSSALCIHADVDFTQAWRGFMRVGPGKRTAEIVANIYSIYISPMHDIQPYGAHSLVDPFCLSHTLEAMIIPEDNATLQTNLGHLAPWVELSPMWYSRVNCCGDIMAANLISIEIFPLSFDNNFDQASSGKDDSRDTFGAVPIQNDYDRNKRNELKFSLSLKDAQFIAATVAQLKASIAAVKSFPVVDQYPVMMHCLSDINHLPLLTFYLISADAKKPIVPWVVRDIDVVCDICDIKVLLRNNTYNLKVLKAHLASTRVSYNKTDGRLHVAAGTTYSVWAHNDVADEWEPLVESTSLSAVAATDATKAGSDEASSATTTDTSLVRIEFFCNPIDINLSQHTLADVIRKFNLSDVVTTSSSELPPYRVINDLGIAIQCCVTVGQYENILDCIGVSGQVPIESSMLSQTSSADRRYRRGSRIDTSFNTKGENEHFLGFKMIYQGKLFSSKSPLAISREGLFPFEMNTANRCKRNQESEGLLNAASMPKRQSSSTDAAVAPAATSADSKDNPYTFINIRIKGDGSRELTLRSMLSIKNNTKRLMQIQMLYKQEKYETSIGPQVEINIPVFVVHSKASLFIRFGDKSEWIEALSSLSTLVSQGFWEAPTKLRAEMIPCPPETMDVVNSSWIILMKPEVKDIRSGNKSYVSVRYPSSENSKTSSIGDTYDGTVMLDDNIYNLSKNYLKSIKIVSPVCIQLLPPLQLCNVVCQPLLYRLADKDGSIVSEGVLVPGEVVDVNTLRDLFRTQFYLSVRMLNYCWSKWVKLLSKHNPYAATEKNVELTMHSMDLMIDSDAVNALHLPSLVLNLSLREHFVRISCPIFINNRTGIPLDISDHALKDQFIPQVVGTSLSTIMLSKVPIKGNSSSSSTNLVNAASNPFPDSDAESSDDSDSSSDSGVSLGNCVDDSPVTACPGVKPKNTLHTLIVHFPNDHLRKLEVVAADSWTLLDVFNSIAPKLSVNRSHQTETNYLFFYFDEIKNWSKRVSPSPIEEQDAFVSRTLLGGSSAGSSSPSATSSVDADKEKGGIKSMFSSASSKLSSLASGATDPLPHSMALSMIVQCNMSPLPMSTTVASLTASRIRLCHMSEWNIYKQIMSIRQSVEKKEASFSNIFGKQKTIYRCNFVDFVGYIPFNPINSRKILGFSPTMSLRVVDGTSSSSNSSLSRKSEWSDGLDLLKADLTTASEYMNISFFSQTAKESKGDLSTSKLIDGGLNRTYQFGVFVEKGKNFYQNITAVSIVPR